MKKYFLPAIILLLLNTASAQGTMDIKVKKPDSMIRPFVYNGKPVSPMALIDLFQLEEGGPSKSSVDLKKYPFQDTWTNKDSSSKWIGLREPRHEKDGVYFMDLYMDETIEGAYIFYNVIGLTKGKKFVVNSHCFLGGLQYVTNVLILDIKGDQLIKLGGFIDTLGAVGYPYEIKGDSIINRSIIDTIIRYPIPASAR